MGWGESMGRAKRGVKSSMIFTGIGGTNTIR